MNGKAQVLNFSFSILLICECMSCSCPKISECKWKLIRPALVVRFFVGLETLSFGYNFSLFLYFNPLYISLIYGVFLNKALHVFDDDLKSIFYIHEYP